MPRLTCLIALTLTLLAGVAGPVQAQNANPYAPRVIVNDRAITNYEITQRMNLLRVLGNPGNLEETAREALIDDRLRLDAAAEQGLALDEDQIQAGLEEFGARGNLNVDQLLQFMAANGISRDALVDLIEPQLLWRDVVRNRFGPRAQITEAEIDRAVALSSRSGGARVLLSEILLRADTPAFQAQAETLANRLSTEITTPEAFAAAARRYSVSGSAGRGGRIDWLELSNLPPQLASVVLSLGPGEVSEPIPITNAIALFQLRAIEELDAGTPETLSVEYAQFLLPEGDTNAAARVQAEIDTCDDLYGVAKGLPEERLLREVQPVAEIPQDIALELAKLDTGETTTIARGGVLSVLMLCGRTEQATEAIDRDAVRIRLRNQRLTSYADGYLAELRADAIIRTP